MSDMTVTNKAARKRREQSYWGGVVQRLFRNRLATISLIVLTVLVLACHHRAGGLALRDPADGYDRQGPSALRGALAGDRQYRARPVHPPILCGRISLGIAPGRDGDQCLIGVILGQHRGLFMEA